MVVPADLPRISVSGDGSLAAIHEPSRVTLVALPSAAAFAEISVDPDALASEIMWVGAAPRLLVLSRYDGHSTAHLIDPDGPRPIAEIRLEATMRLVATVGTWALAVGSPGAAVLSSTETHLTVYPFPSRVVPTTAGAAGSQFLAALSGTIEEWDPQSRMPRRRLRLPRSASITSVGGSERLVWMTTQQEPSRIEVVPLVNRGQPRAHELPEPILRIAGHPRSDLIACIGAESGKLYLIDLDGRTPMRVLEPDAIDRVDAVSLVVGRIIGVLAAQAGRPIALMRLDGRELEHDSAAPAVVARSAPVSGPIADERDVVDHGRSPPAADRAAPDDEPAPLSPASPASNSAASSAAERPLDARASEPDGGCAHPASQRLADPPAERPSASEPALSSARVTPASGRLDARPASHDRPAVRPGSAPPSGSAVLGVVAATPSATPGSHQSRPVSSVSERFSAWRDKVRQSQVSSPPAGQEDPATPDGDAQHRSGMQVPDLHSLGEEPRPGAAPVQVDAPPSSAAPVRVDAPPPSVSRNRSRVFAHVHRAAPRSWRDELVSWSQAARSGNAAATDEDMPAAFAIEGLVSRFELDPQLQPVVALLYGAHLCGEAGVAPVDIARLLDRSWDEALGRGELARCGVCEYARSRVALAPAVLRALDELPPLTGALLGPPGPIALLGPCVVVAPDEPLTEIAERCLGLVGSAILVGHAASSYAALVFDARAHGAAAMLRIAEPQAASSTDPAIFVVDSTALADALGVPQLG